MTANSKKCAHKSCTCFAAEGSDYCSTFCENMKDTTTLECDCHHLTCDGQKL